MFKFMSADDTIKITYMYIQSLTSFSSTPQSECLTDKPTKVTELQFPVKLPGELYDADIQCKWQFGRRAQLCTYDFGKVSPFLLCH